MYEKNRYGTFGPSPDRSRKPFERERCFWPDGKGDQRKPEATAAKTRSSKKLVAESRIGF